MVGQGRNSQSVSVTTEMTRFTAYMSVRERELLAAKAAEQHTSVNFLVRVAVRKYLGITKPGPDEAD